MMALSVSTLALLIVWGTAVALDLVSVPQGLLARPIVAGSVAGCITGDPMVGVRVGVLFELFALDVLPVGAVRYPDYGPATVAAVAVATGMPWPIGLGVGGAVGLIVAAIGGWSLQIVRRKNAQAVQRHAAALAAGESRAIRWLQYSSLARDAVRGAVLTAVGLAFAWIVAREGAWLNARAATALTLVMLGAGFAAVLGGAVRGAGRGLRMTWLVAGLGVGGVLAALL